MPKKLSAAAKRAMASAKKNRGTPKLAAKANKARKGIQAATIAEVGGRASRSDVAASRSLVGAIPGKKGSKARTSKIKTAINRSGLMMGAETEGTKSKRKDLGKASLFRKTGRKNRASLKAGSTGSSKHDNN